VALRAGGPGQCSFYFGGTSLLIVVGVAMDTVQQIEAQLVMRNYEGFVKKGKLRKPAVWLIRRPAGGMPLIMR
jgi:hypothetical protein